MRGLLWDFTEPKSLQDDTKTSQEKPSTKKRGRSNKTLSFIYGNTHLETFSCGDSSALAGSGSVPPTSQAGRTIGEMLDDRVQKSRNNSARVLDLSDKVHKDR